MDDKNIIKLTKSQSENCFEMLDSKVAINEKTIELQENNEMMSSNQINLMYFSQAK